MRLELSCASAAQCSPQRSGLPLNFGPSGRTPWTVPANILSCLVLFVPLSDSAFSGWSHRDLCISPFQHWPQRPCPSPSPGFWSGIDLYPTSLRTQLPLLPRHLLTSRPRLSVSTVGIWRQTFPIPDAVPVVQKASSYRILRIFANSQRPDCFFPPSPLTSCSWPRPSVVREAPVFEKLFARNQTCRSRSAPRLVDAPWRLAKVPRNTIGPLSDPSLNRLPSLRLIHRNCRPLCRP